MRRGDVGAGREAPLAAIFAFYFWSTFRQEVRPRGPGGCRAIASRLQQARAVPGGSFWDPKACWRRALVFPSPAAFPACPALAAGAGVHNPFILTSSLHQGRCAFRHVPISKFEENGHLLIHFLDCSPLLFSPLYQPTRIWRTGGKM